MKKNIVIVVSAMNMGGAQRVVSILANHWSQNGHSVTLICTFTGERNSHYKIDKNVNLIYLSNSPFLSKNKNLNLVWKLGSLRKAIKVQNPDVIVSFLARVNVATTISTIGIKSSLIICERTWPPFASLKSKTLWTYKKLFKLANRVIVQTDKSKSWLTENFSITDAKVIPNPIVYPLPSKKKGSQSPNSLILAKRKVILASGRMHKFKQFDVLIRAFSDIKDRCPEWDLVILGDGEERDSLEQILFDLGLSGRVYFPGSVGNMSEWYERADLFVLSSVVEGFPNVLLEAMAYGLPCVSFDCDTGPRDMIQNGINGILVAPSEKELGLARAMEKFIKNKNFRNKIARNAITVRDKYSVNNIMQKWDQVLD